MSNVLEHTFVVGPRKHNEGAGVLEVFYHLLRFYKIFLSTLLFQSIDHTIGTRMKILQRKLKR